MYQIDNDTNPPVLSANLSIAKGSKQTLSITIPRKYYNQHAPLTYMYVNNYGGKIEGITQNGNTVTLTAYSKQGSNTLEHARVNPVNVNSTTVQTWLDSLCSLASASSAFSGDNVILASNPYTTGQAIASLIQCLATITNCYGIDFFHVSTTQGDSFIFSQPALNISYTLDTYITDISYTHNDTAYKQFIIVRTVPIEQKEEIALGADRNYTLQKTAQNHPYLEAEIEYIPIDRYWDGKITTFDYQELHNLDAETVIQDWDTIDSQDEWYRSKFAYAPYFGTHLVKRVHWKKHTLYYIVITGSPYGWDTTEQRIGYAEDPEWDPYEIADGESTSETNQYYGVWSTNRPWAYYDWSTMSSVWYLNPSPIGPNPDIEHGGDSGISDYGDVYPNPPNYFLQTYRTSDSWQQSDYRHKASSQEGYQTYKTVRGESDYTDTITQYQPTVYQYPWLPIAREQVSRVMHSQSVDTHVEGETETEYTETLTVSKALFDAGFNDSYHPPTIDENFLETGSLSNIHLDKSSHTWFDAEAAPAEDRQYMGLGAVQNYKYKLANSQEKITLTPGHEPGRLTAKWENGTRTDLYNIARQFSLNRLGNNTTVHCTFISSTQEAFTTAPWRQEDRTYTITGSVWRNKPLAEACIPYITRQHTDNRQVTFTIPFALLGITSLITLLGKTCLIYSENVYITGLNADFRTEMTVITGYVLPDE